MSSSTNIKFIFHNTHKTLGLVPSTVSYWIVLSCWRKATPTIYVASRLKLLQQKFFGRHHKLVDHNEISTFQMASGLFPFTYREISFLYHWQDFHVQEDFFRLSLTRLLRTGRFLSSITDKTFTYRKISFLYHWQDFYRTMSNTAGVL